MRSFERGQNAFGCTQLFERFECLVISRRDVLHPAYSLKQGVLGSEFLPSQGPDNCCNKEKRPGEKVTQENSYIIKKDHAVAPFQVK